jgi:hypothetical protein
MLVYYGPSHALHNIRFHEISSSGSRVSCQQTDREADRYDEATLYVLFWVIPRRLNFICRRFGTLSVPSS